MKIVNSPIENEFEIPFEGWTYVVFPKSPVLVEDNVANFLKERYPFLELSDPSEEKEKIPSKIARRKTPVFVNRDQSRDMLVTPRDGVNRELGSVDGLPQTGVTDRDGVEWIGEGIQVENLTGEGKFH